MENIINISILKTVFRQTKFNEEIMKSLLISFFKDVDELFIKISDSIETQKYDEVKFHIHSLKGLSGTIGTIKLHKDLIKTEAILKNSDYTSLNNQLAIINEDIFMSKEFLLKFNFNELIP
ncbi:MAG: Hpt domain-containing protein [Bacteroidota bacterium]|nr:Hpt domain-containing protein [Bacteroidota bacterium]